MSICCLIGKQFLSSVFILIGALRRKAEKTKVSEIEKILEHVR